MSPSYPADPTTGMKTCKRGHGYDSALTRCPECNTIRYVAQYAKNGKRKAERDRQNPESTTLRHMIQRCHNPKAGAYKDYGGRGIAVCERWRGEGGYTNFLADIGRRPSPLHSIERVNNDLGYSPENCKWALRKEQQRNRRNNRMLTYNGKTQCMQDWSIELGMHKSMLRDRLRKVNWSLEDAINFKKKHKKNYTLLTFDGITMPIAEWGRKIGMQQSTISGRLRMGWSVERALTFPVDTSKDSRRG